MELLSHFYVTLLAGIIENWLRGEIDCTPEELINFSDKMLQDQMRGAQIRLKENSNNP